MGLKNQYLAKCRMLWARAAKKYNHLSPVRAKLRAEEELGKYYDTSCPACQYRKVVDLKACGSDCIVKWSNGHCVGSEYDWELQRVYW